MLSSSTFYLETGFAVYDEMAFEKLLAIDRRAIKEQLDLWRSLFRSLGVRVKDGAIQGRILIWDGEKDVAT